MAVFVPVHAGGDGAWSWYLVGEALRRRGHDVVAIDLPGDDSAGLWDCADAVVAAIGDRSDVVVVAHSWGGFVGPLVCARRPVDALVFVTGMIPAPGESPADWWSNTGHDAARRKAGLADGDDIATYYQDVPAALAEEAMAHSRDFPSMRAYEQRWPLEALPDIPTYFLVCSNDRFFPAGWMRAVVLDRLGIEPDEIATGHCPNLARPDELAERLIDYARRP